MITNHAQIAKRLPQWIYKIGAQAFIDLKFPRHLFIETTATCNLTCHYCPRPRIREDMDFQLFRKIVDEASEFGSRSFSLHLFGEPLLYPRIFEAIYYIRKKNKSHTILFTTNGTKINECIDDLTRAPIDKVLWTWRTEAKFTDQTREKLKNWKPFTVRYIEGTYPKEAKEEGWKRIETRFMHNYGGNIQTEKYRNKSKEMSNPAWKSKTRWPCYHLFLAPAISWDGKFLMCCADPHKKEIFGNVLEETVQKAWQRLEPVRQSHIKGEFSGICKDCDVWREYPSIF